MLALLAVAVLAPIQPGCYGITSLCQRLSEVTGTRHVATANLWDYPVFVSVKSGDPARIRNLVASALLSEWVSDGGKLRLRFKKQGGNDDFLEFKRLFQAAAAKDKVSLGLPIRDLYELPPGRILRYSSSPTPYIRQLPTPSASKGTEADDFVLIRRVAPGAYEYDMGGHEVNFKGLPPSVRSLLSASLQKHPLSPEQQQLIGKLMNDPSAIRSGWKNSASADPISSILELMLNPLAGQLDKDLVMALPDFSIFAMLPGQGTPSIESILEGFSLCDRWNVVDGAAVASLTTCEIDHPSQTVRKAISDFIDEVGEHGVADIVSLSRYNSSQRPTASECWTDAMLLVMAGATVDQEFIGDYPFNIRLYAALTPQDWLLIRAHKPFRASSLSGFAQEELLNVLLQSRSRVQRDSGTDPALWSTLDFQHLTIDTELKEESALIGSAKVPGEVDTVDQAVFNYERRKKELGREPLYQPCLRRRLAITVSAGTPKETVKTGFSEAVLNGSKPVVWSQLPPEIAKAFKQAMGQTKGDQ